MNNYTVTVQGAPYKPGEDFSSPDIQKSELFFAYYPTDLAIRNELLKLVGNEYLVSIFTVDVKPCVWE